MVKHSTIYPSPEELEAVQNMVSTVECALKHVSDWLDEKNKSTKCEGDVEAKEEAAESTAKWVKPQLTTYPCASLNGSFPLNKSRSVTWVCCRWMFIQGGGYIWTFWGGSAGNGNKPSVGSSCSPFLCLFYCDVVKLHLADKPFSSLKQIQFPGTHQCKSTAVCLGAPALWDTKEVFITQQMNFPKPPLLSIIVMV